MHSTLTLQCRLEWAGARLRGSALFGCTARHRAADHERLRAWRMRATTWGRDCTTSAAVTCRGR